LVSLTSMSATACAVNATRHAWRSSPRIRRFGVRVLSVIAELDAAGGCFASLAWIAARAGVHRNTARRWIRTAERLGFLLVVPQRSERGATRSSLLVPSAPMLPAGFATEAIMRSAEHREACESRWAPLGSPRWIAARNERQAPEAQGDLLGVPVCHGVVPCLGVTRHPPPPTPIFGFGRGLHVPGFDLDDPPDILDRLFGSRRT
jgi:hypothetical protein